jgi:hypothetical protein
MMVGDSRSEAQLLRDQIAALEAERDHYRDDLKTVIAAFHRVHRSHVPTSWGHESCHCPPAVQVYDVEARLRESADKSKETL